MDLIRAFGLDTRTQQNNAPLRAAIVGAGGKTSVLFSLARSLKSPVIVTTTTHLGIWQLRYADRAFSINSEATLRKAFDRLAAGVNVFTTPETKPGRVGGLSAENLALLKGLSDERQLPVLIEADGARSKPAKAPGEDEPVIPDWVNVVIVVAGLNVLGKKLSDEWVFRADMFARLSGLPHGALIDADALCRMLLHQDGGLKHIPANADRIVVLTHADAPEVYRKAYRLAGSLLPKFHRVVIAAGEREYDDDSPVNLRVVSTRVPVAGIILAAGASRRLGQPKQLLPWHGQSLLRRAVAMALSGGLAPVIVVVGAEAERMRSEIADLPVIVVDNPDWQAGQSTSVAAGVRALPVGAGGAVFMLADQPFVTAELIRALLETYARERSPLTAPFVDGIRSNPVLFDRETFPALLRLQGDRGGRGLFSEYPVSRVNWEDVKLLMDIDTPDDYRHLLDM